MDSMLVPRHTMETAGANSTIEYHWGYVTRVMPCTQNAITCAYLDICYNTHDTSMLYTFILWAVILGAALVFLFFRGWNRTMHYHRSQSLLDKAINGFQTIKRKYLLQDSPLASLFPRTSRLQVLVLAIMLAYLLIFSFVGILYRTWVDVPSPAYPKIRTRTSFGPWSDRVGILAYALTPFSILLASRESILSLATGIPYQHFNFLHRWIGRVIYIQSVLHTIGWTVVEARLYRPQPDTYKAFLQEQYAIFGVVAMFILSVLVFLSLKPVIRRTGYEVFKISHTILAILYLGACWGHWDPLWCWMVAGLALIFIDYAIRTLRIVYLHFTNAPTSSFGIKPATATITLFTNPSSPSDTVIRLDFDHHHREPWQPGQHFFLTFPSLSIWQAHPLTPSSLSIPKPNTTQRHTYIIRARSGTTNSLAALGPGATLPVILTGPYGNSHPHEVEGKNHLLISGGTGVSFTYPILAETIRRRSSGALEFVWIVRHAQDVLWLGEEVAWLKGVVGEKGGVRVRVFVTRESQTLASSDSSVASETAGKGGEEKGTGDVLVQEFSASSEEEVGRLRSLLTPSVGFEVVFLKDHHPDLSALVQEFAGRMEDLGLDAAGLEILGSGPPAMDSDFRLAVSRLRCKCEKVGAYFDSR